MFDFGFWEILMVVLVALIVVGPERMPGLARTAGLWVGKAKRMIADVKSEIDNELAMSELKKALDEQDLMEDVYEVIEETKQAGQDVAKEIQETRQASQGVEQKIEHDVTPDASNDVDKIEKS